jgi:hypothetical protein
MEMDLDQSLSVSEILHALGIEDSGEDTEEYFVIPGNWGPRWLIPAKTRVSAYTLSTWHPYTIPSRIKWFALRMAARTGALRMLRTVSRVAVSRAAVRLWFERCGIRAQAAEFVILVGNPSADRKLVVFMLDDRHRITAILKVGLTASSGRSILHEADVLDKLKTYRWTPKVLSVHFDQQAAVQEFVPGPMPDRNFSAKYLDLLCQFPRNGTSRNLANLAQEMACRIDPYKDRIDALAPDLLPRVLDRLHLDRDLPTLLVHGDFSPWNLRINPQRGPVLVDWEWGDLAGLPASDLLYFYFNIDRHFNGAVGGYSAIRSLPICSEYFRRMDIDAQLLPQLAIALLLSQLESHCKLGLTQYTTYALRQLSAVTE